MRRATFDCIFVYSIKITHSNILHHVKRQRENENLCRKCVLITNGPYFYALKMLEISEQNENEFVEVN